jgi:outer membrane usher protein
VRTPFHASDETFGLPLRVSCHPAVWRRLSRPAAFGLCVCCGCLSVQVASAQTESPYSAEDAQPVILDVRINGQPQEAMRPMRRRGAQLLFGRTDLEAWHLLVPVGPAAQIGGIDYYDLRDAAGVRVTLDERTQTVNLQVPPEAFAAGTAQARTAARMPLSPAALGAFLNYDVALQRDRQGPRASGYFDAAVSGTWGVMASNVVVGQSSFGGGHGATRLDTYYRYDDPERLTRLTVGDSITQGAVWSTPFRFGGVQFGTQFSLQPGYISYPTPTLRGGSAVPSAVEVYVNDTLRYQDKVNAGPFAISDVPVLTGAGEMRFAVTDALGVRRTVTTPYYVSSSLLRAGLSDYSIAFGWTRLRYGERSFDYGRPFVSGNWRKGLDDTVTVELHGEADARSQATGGGLNWVWAPIGEFGLHGAASRSSDGRHGTLARASFSRTSNDWNFSASRQVASRDFTQIGWQDSDLHITGQSQVFAGRTLGRFGTLGASYTQLRYNSGERIGVLTASWSMAVAGNAWVSTYASRTTQNGMRPTTTVGVTLTVPLGERRNLSVSTQRSEGRNTTTAEVNQSPPSDAGYGYHLLVSRGELQRTEASVGWLGRYGTLTAEAASLNGDTGLRLRASGAVGYAQGLAFATRQSDDAFAVVTVPGAPGIKVYRENQPWATTDAEGRAIVTGLRAYEANRISIANTDLPIEAQVRSDTVQVVPRYKGVAIAAFDISYDTLAVAIVRLPDGRPLPPGIDVWSGTRATPLLSGYGGTVSIERPQAGEHFDARWRGGQCRFTLGAVLPQDILPGLGPYTCEPIDAAPPPR